MRNVHKIAIAAAMGFGLLATSACAGPSAAPAENGDPKQAEVRAVSVIVSTLVDTSPVYIAAEQGLFEDRGLDVTINVAPTPGARIPALVSGAAQFGLIGTADVLQASSAGVPLRVVGATTFTTDKPKEDTGKVYVAKGSSIRTAADLVGKTIAVGGLGGGGELSLRAALDMAGADASKVKFLEVPFDSMLNSLQTNQVDAISTVSPFTGAAEASGAVHLMSPGAIALPGAAQQLAVTTEAFLKANKSTVEDFIAALAEATEFAAQNPDDVRRILPTFSKTPAEVAKVMQLPKFSPDLEKSAVQEWADLMLEYGFVKAKIKVDELVVSVR